MAYCSYSKRIISFCKKRKHKQFLNESEEAIHMNSRSSITDLQGFGIFVFKLLSALSLEVHLSLAKVEGFLYILSLSVKDFTSAVKQE